MYILTLFNRNYRILYFYSLQNITGEVYEVDEDMLKCLDICEDCPNLYDRRPIKVVLNNAVTVECKCYFLIRFKNKLLDLPFIDNYYSEGPHGRPYLPELDEEYDDYSEVQEIA